MPFLVDWILCAGAAAVMLFLPGNNQGLVVLKVVLAGLLIAIAISFAGPPGG